MKKILATLIGLAAGAALVQAQGYLEMSSGISFNVQTNTGTFGNTTTPDGNAGYSSIISGKTQAYASGVNGGVPLFDYAYLFTPTGVGTSGDFANLNDGNWVQLYVDLGGTPSGALFGTNVASAGNWGGQGGNVTSPQAIGSGSQAFNNGTDYSIALVAWSSNLGSSWSQVLAEYSTGNWSGIGNFGYVTAASVNPNGATPGNTPTAMFGNGSLVLYTVSPVPEPTTLALAGLGGLSMLFLRRRKA
jgi:hypothetical protein